MITGEFYHTSNQVNFGDYILPIDRIKIYDPDKWEVFIEEWLDLKKEKYIKIERLGGANDMGRDVIGYISITKNTYTWDCYQCKHYKNALTPSDVYVEIGKILYYTFQKEYPIPNNYYFIASNDIGTSLSKLLLNPNELKNQVLSNWDKKCKSKITQKENLDLNEMPDFKEYIEKFDYSIFSKFPVKDIIEEHKNHPNHTIRFGGGVTKRPIIGKIPDIGKDETNYIMNLYEVYGDELGIKIDNSNVLTGEHLLHFDRARRCFHFSEQLKNFYRDSLPQGVFEDLQNEIYTGVSCIKKDTGIKTVKAVESESIKINIDSNPLKEVLKSQDKIGICHQLSNNNILKWK